MRMPDALKTWCRLRALALLGTLPMFNAFSAEPPAPHDPVPSERQLAWHDMDAYAFIHFGINTFTDKEWGYGDESESLFNPIARTVSEAGMKGIVLTCKHHDGFALWPSRYTDHSVRNSPWMDGKGDLVREISDACRRYNLKFGIYLSPWDRNRADYGTPAYIDYYRNQLRELLTGYGPIFEVWFDGANGGDGYYGGARERRTIDNRTYYDWPDVRWVGNESGFAGETCWATVNREGMYPGHADPKDLNEGVRDGADWLPAEVDVSIRPGWFYHAAEDGKVKTVAQLLRIYFDSVGRGANLILNLPPDRRGRIHENDVEALRGWRKALDQTFTEDLAAGAAATASNTRGGDTRFGPACVTDGRRDTYWATDDDVKKPQLVLDLGQAKTFNVVRLREALPLGQRIDAFALDAWADGEWSEFAHGTSIGNQRLTLTRDITTTKVRLRVTDAAACPAISEVGLFRMPGDIRNAVLALDRNGGETER